MAYYDGAIKSLARSSYVTVAQSPADELGLGHNNVVRKLHSSGARRLGYSIAQSFTKTTKAARRVVKGASTEEPKPLATQSKRRVATVCFIHTVPILASIVLAAMNLKGYYIGAELTGGSDQSTQAIYTLCLQVTAKLMVRSIL